MSEDKYSLASKIVDFSISDNPAKVKDTVDQLMMDKIRDEVEIRKVELARQMFNDAVDDPNEEDENDAPLTDMEDEEFDDDSEMEDYADEDSDIETEVEITDDELEDLFGSLEDLEDLETLDDIIDPEYDNETDNEE